MRASCSLFIKILLPYGHVVSRSDGVSKSVIKRAKTEMREKEHAKTFQAAGGLSVSKGIGKNNKPSGGKINRPVFAVGGLDADMHDWSGASKPMKEKKNKKNAGKEKEFTEFDSSKRLRKGGKLGNKAFKSKGKHKRR